MVPAQFTEHYIPGTMLNGLPALPTNPTGQLLLFLVTRKESEAPEVKGLGQHHTTSKWRGAEI